MNKDTKHLNHESILRDALDKVRGFGKSDMGYQEMCDYVTEVANEALELTKHGQSETLDLMRDEFKRIHALTDNTEIKGLCDRAISNITQLVPVIAQRDKAQTRGDKLWKALYVLKERARIGYDFDTDPDSVFRIVEDTLRETL